MVYTMKVIGKLKNTTIMVLVHKIESDNLVLDFDKVTQLSLI